MTRKPKRNQAVYLHITTWVGSCVVGAQHYYGRLVSEVDGMDRNVVRLEMVLTAKAAKEMTDSELDDVGAPKYEAGDTTARFLHKKDLVVVARKTWQKIMPKGIVLFEGDPLACQPQLALDGPKELVDANNKFYKRVEACYDAHGYDIVKSKEKEYEKANKEWRAFMKKHKVKL